MKQKNKTKKQIIIKLYKDKFIDERVLWNLLGSKFKKHEVELMDRVFRRSPKKSIVYM